MVADAVLVERETHRHVRVGELHDRPVGVAREEERLAPFGLAQVDAHRCEPRGRDVVEGAREVVDLEREVMGTGAVALEEPLEEVVAVDVPWFEQLDLHATGVVPEEHLHRSEADPLAAGDHRAAEAADEGRERVGDVARRERNMVQPHRRLFAQTGRGSGDGSDGGAVSGAGGGASRRPARVKIRASTYPMPSTMKPPTASSK